MQFTEVWNLKVSEVSHQSHMPCAEDGTKKEKNSGAEKMLRRREERVAD